MTCSTSRALALAWVVAPLLVLSGLAEAANDGSNIDTLMRQVRGDPDFKVRLSAALGLGRQGDPRAIPVLVEALTDKTPSVRAVSLGALMKLVDRRVGPEVRAQAMAVVSRLSKEDPDASARQAAVEALAALEFVDRAVRPRPLNGAVFVYVEAIQGAVAELEPQAVSKLNETARDELSAADLTFVTDWPGAKLPTPTDLKKAKTRAAFTIMVNLDPLEVRAEGASARVQCRIKLVLASYPEKAMRSLMSGGGALAGQNRPEAIEQAKERCVMDVLKQLIGGQMVAAIRAQNK